MSESLPQPILIVDSDEQSINHIASGLKDSGYLVITAPDGYDGYVRARNESPNVIIANDLLPYVSGFKLSKLIKCVTERNVYVFPIENQNSNSCIINLLQLVKS